MLKCRNGYSVVLREQNSRFFPRYSAAYSKRSDLQCRAILDTLAETFLCLFEIVIQSLFRSGVSNRTFLFFKLRVTCQ